MKTPTSRPAREDTARRHPPEPAVNRAGRRIRRRIPRTPFGRRTLARENACFHGSGGVSDGNRAFGFRPAFLDTQTRIVYLSCFANGEPAPCHLLDGLPDELVVTREAGGRVTEVKPTLVSGFVLDGCFYDREAAARKVAAEP